jgi:valyl-tRNA synthetase
MHRMGFAASWDQLHFTLDPDIHHSVMTAFVRLYDKGLIYRAQRLVHWDGTLHTALSDLEVINQPAKGHLWHLRYAWSQDPSQGIVVATTRPETLFADQAIMVHPQDSRYAHWIGRSVIIPLSQRVIPVIADESVDMDKGTGAVKVTPGHDVTDFDVGRRHGLPIVSLWDESLRYNDLVPEGFRGMSRDTARTAVLESLGDALVAVDNIEHQVPYSERSGCLVEPLLTWQWFVDMESMAHRACTAIDQGDIRFYPLEWANNAKRWLENIQPWCVSRQLWWGHRLPVWYGPNGSVYVAITEEEAYAKAQSEWGPNVVLSQDNDVLDTWFSSGLWPMATLGWPCQDKSAWQERLPTNILVTGFDILFFWVARMMMLGLEMTDTLPFHEVYIHPLIRDAHGQKMSKTKNNVINPLALIDDYGADAVRFALASATSGKQHMKFALQNVENAKHFVTKVTNVFKFARLKGMGSPDAACPWAMGDQWPDTILHPINGWIRNKTAHMLDEWQTHITQYRFAEASLAVYQWVWREVCDVYVEWVKKLITHPEYANEVRQTLTCVMSVVVRVLHPIMPFVTDFMWHEWSQELGHVMSAPWPQVSPVDPWMEECMDDVQRLMTLVRAQRSKESLPKTHVLSYALSDLAPQALQGLPHWQSIVQEWVGVSLA